MKASKWVKTTIVLAVGGLAAMGAWRHYGGAQQAQFVTAELARGEIRATISATGTCNALVTVQVGSQVSGNIEELYADFNTKVKKGQVVAQIDPALFEARLKQAEANLESQKASVVNAVASLRGSEADVASARAGLESQKANAVKARVSRQDARSKLDHSEELYRRGIVSMEERDTARATYDSAVASVDAADAQVKASEYQVKAAEAQLDVVQTRLDQARAQERVTSATLEQARIDLAHTKIVAPVDGTVIARKMDKGQTVAASFQAPEIFQIAQDLTKMQVVANVDEADVGQVRDGQVATFTVDAYPGDVFRGTVKQIRMAPNTQQNVVTYDAVIEVGNEDLKLFPGMTAQVRIEVDRRRDALKLPNAALRVAMPGVEGLTAMAATEVADSDEAAAGTRPGEGPLSTVWVLAADGKPRDARVELGITDGQFSEVRAVRQGTLVEGDAVIVAVLPAGGATAAAGPGGGQRRGGPPF
jgi:HlyD family secretion protein